MTIAAKDRAVEAIARHAEPLPPIDDAQSFGAMFDRFADARVVLLGDASATKMGWSGEFNIGELARGHFGREAALIGFGTDRGTVACASDWDEPMEVKPVRPSREDSWEHTFLQARVPASLTDWRSPDRQDLRDALNDTRLGRAIGVIYRFETERRSHYFEAVLADQFDALVWFEETRAVTPLDLEVGAAGAEDETFPFGL